MLMGFTFSSVSLLVTRVSSSSEDSCQGFDYSFLASIYSVQFLGAFAVIFTVDWIGRVNSIVLFFLISSLGIVLLGLSGGPALFESAWLMEFSGSIALAAGMGASAAVWVTTPEQYETSIRSTGHTAAAAMARIGALCSSYWVDSAVPDLWVAALLGVGCVVAASAAWTLPERMSDKLS